VYKCYFCFFRLQDKLKVQELINLLQEAIDNKPEIADKDIFVADSTALLEPFGIIIESDKIIIDC
jgi:hypothetical protein